jgi:hypothetical protein
MEAVGEEQTVTVPGLSRGVGVGAAQLGRNTKDVRVR